MGDKSSRMSNNAALRALVGIQNNGWGGKYLKKSYEFYGTAGSSGSTGTWDLFTVSGDIVATVVAVCKANVSGTTGTVEVGVEGSTAGFIAQTSGSQIDVGEIWHDNAPDKKLEAITVAAPKIITSDIILTIGTANLTAGSIDFHCFWTPIGESGSVEAA